MCPVKQGHWPGHPGWPSSLDASWLEPVTREDRRRGLTTNNHIPKSPPAAWWGRAAAARIYCCKLKESESEVAQSCLTLCDPMDCGLPGSSVHGIFQARVLEWVAISFSRGSSWSRDQTQVSHIEGRRFTIWATREVLVIVVPNVIKLMWKLAKVYM